MAGFVQLYILMAVIELVAITFYFSPIGAQHFSGITKNSKLLVNTAPAAIFLILHQLSRLD